MRENKSGHSYRNVKEKCQALQYVEGDQDRGSDE